jgi:GNAT superfamily N-acetyltransferase
MVDTGIDVRDEAWRVARAAERRLDIQIRDLASLDDQQAAAELLRRVWRADSADQIVNAGMMRAFAHSGNYVVGAFRGSTLVAVAVGFFGADHLHSHVTGVDPAGQSGGVGYAVKLHQRAWALARGVGAVCWTFDPLIRRNAYFNLHKLGARATASTWATRATACTSGGSWRHRPPSRRPRATVRILTRRVRRFSSGAPTHLAPKLPYRAYWACRHRAGWP